MSNSLADHPILVFTAVIIGPPISSQFDFISDEWRTIRLTRRIGMGQLFVSLPSVVFINYYFLLQMKNGDYKEAATALVLQLVISFFVLRTIWGLILLNEFRIWNISALRCLVLLGYSRVLRSYLFDYSTNNSFDLSLETIKRTVDYGMVVNSSLIDNEFSDVDQPVLFAIFSRVRYSDLERNSAILRFVASCLKSRKPDECSVRWLVSFLAKFGSRWVADTRGLRLHDTESLTDFQRQNIAILAYAHTTQGSVEDNGSTEKFSTLRSPFHGYITGGVHFPEGTVSITQRCMLPFKMNGDVGGTVDFYSQQATIRDAAKDDWHKASLNQLNDEERSAVENITAAQLAYFAVLMEETIICAAEVNKVSCDSSWPVHCEDGDPRIDTLMCQLGNDSGEDYEQFFQTLQIRKDVSSSFLWDNNPICLLLQTSVHVDNHLALESGDRLDAYVEEYWTKSHLGKPKLTTSKLTTSVFEKQYDLQMRLLRHEVTRRKWNRSIQCDTPRFIGCAVETVRSILASWVAENDADAVEWNASIAPVGIRFLCSTQLRSIFSEMQNRRLSEKEMRRLYMRLVWEVQAYLQWMVKEEVGRKNGDIRQSPFLIMLFILGFPSLKMETTNDQRGSSDSSWGDHIVAFNDVITVKPVAGPQEVRILLTIDESSEAVSVVFRPESNVFHWQEWKDAFMGRLAAQKNWRLTRLSSNNELLRTEANHSDICSLVEHIGPEVLGNDYGVTFWSGWPPYMPQIAHFEIRNLVKKQSELCASKHLPRELKELIGALNTAMNIHFGQKTELAKLYSNGHRAMEEGRTVDAVKLFGICIAEYGHREALKDAFDIIRMKSSVHDPEVGALQTKMNVQFKTLLNGSNTEEQNRAEDKIDLAMLADYFGRIFDLTGSQDALKKKALALFYEKGANNPVSEAAMEAIESLIIYDFENFSHSSLLFYLAVAHQSLFQASQDPEEQEIAAKCLLGAKYWTYSFNSIECFALNVGYLLEKGFFVGRDRERKNAMIEIFCESEANGDAKMLRVMFDRLFVKESTSEEGANEVSARDRVFGIGVRPKDAISLYNRLPYLSSKCTNRLGLLYHKGAEGVSINASAAEENYSVAIEEGDNNALCNMGVLKSGITGDDTGISYMKDSVEAGSSTGMNNLAIAHEFGNGVNRDVLGAERLYKQAIEVDNNPVAMYNLAVLYMWEDPEFRADGNMSVSQYLISKLTELEPLYILQEQVRKFAVLRSGNHDAVLSGNVELEELDDCLAYVKILESCEPDREAGDVQPFTLPN